jgi:host factor-I protein
MTNFNVGLPSIRQLQTFIKEKQELEIKLITGDTFTGKILWQDENCICFMDNHNQKIFLWYQSIVYFKPKS